MTAATAPAPITPLQSEVLPSLVSATEILRRVMPKHPLTRRARAKRDDDLANIRRIYSDVYEILSPHAQYVFHSFHGASGESDAIRRALWSEGLNYFEVLAVESMLDYVGSVNPSFRPTA
jgi:hypothetical protein